MNDNRLEFKLYKDKELYRILSHILENINDDSTWGGQDFEDWRFIITTMTVDLIISCNVSPDAKWLVKNKSVSLKKTFEYLNNSISSNGLIGEDYWDACRLGIVINKYSLFEQIPNYKILHTYIIEKIKVREYANKNQNWSGAGFYAISVDYLDSLTTSNTDLLNISNSIYDELLKLQCDDGSFKGTIGKGGREFVHPIWHSEQALRTLIRRGVSEKDNKIVKLVDWIREAQEDDGSFKDFSSYTIYYTACAVIGLTKMVAPPKDIINSCLVFLKNSIASSGKVADSGGTIMAGLAFRAVESKNLFFNATILDLRKLEMLEVFNEQLEKKYADIKVENDRKNELIDKYEKKYQNAEIVLTKKEAFKIGIYVAIAFFVMELAQPTLNSYFDEKKEEQRKQDEKEEREKKERTLQFPEKKSEKALNQTIDSTKIKLK